VAPKLPKRYQTQVRLGRDGDIDEWLATDTTLDRPVLLRILDASASRDRVKEFLTHTRAAAAVSHAHLSKVYAVGEQTPAYAVLEWNGGVSIADRVAAGDVLPAGEFLPNAAGLADGLAALHASGTSHGRLDAGAIQFSAAHPAKLAAFGRADGPFDDTVGLAVSLRLGVTGNLDPALAPSQIVEGLPPKVDAVLDDAQAGRIDAAQLASALRAIPPTPRPGTTSSGWSWGWLSVVLALVVTALVVAVIGLSIDTDPDSPFLFPVTPTQTTTAPTTTTQDPIDEPSTTTTTVVTNGARFLLGATPSVYDPYGDGEERNGTLDNITDGDTTSTWRTERYFAELALIKPGVGVTFIVDGTPDTVEMLASIGTAVEIRWRQTVDANPENWELIVRTVIDRPATEIALPERSGGAWLLWFTAIPEQTDDVWFTRLSEVTFSTG
jgi:hypothetical protein